MALKNLGQEAVGLTGQQAGIIAQGRHYQGRISRVEADRVRAELAAGRVPVVAGYWGVNEDQEIFTLGRGASDTTAVALATPWMPTAENCKDVRGVYTADPRIVPRKEDEDISYEEMLEMATLVFAVMHNRAVSSLPSTRPSW